MPFKKRFYKAYLPFYPTLIEQFDLSEYDLVISSSYLFAKGVLTASNACHICYCHTPFRQAWELYHYYKKVTAKGLSKALYSLLFNYLRLWDKVASDRVDYFISNSLNVKNRIKKYYRRDAEVIYPPVDVNSFAISDASKDYFLCLSRLVPYKKIDIVVEAFKKLGERLVVIGQGPELKRIKNIAASVSNIELIQYVSQTEKQAYLANSKALIFPSYEDFGIVPVESLASGRPVIAYYKGGARESVQEGVSGLFFDKQTPEAIRAAVEQFDEYTWDPASIKQTTEKFSQERFKQEFRDFIARIFHSL